MLLSLFTKTQYQTLALPERIEGRFYVCDPVDGSELFAVTGDASTSAEPLASPRSCWVIKEGSLGRLPKGKPVVLENGTLLKARIGWNLEPAYLFAEEGGERYAHYARCMVPDNAQYVVGSGSDCDIVCTQQHVAKRHCILRCRDRVWTVTDCGSSLGTYVNGHKVGTQPQTLKPGDVVSVLNQKFIPLPGLLCLNAQNLDGASIKRSMQPLKLPSTSTLQPLGKDKPVTFFHREPRFTDALATTNLEVEAPPAPHAQPDDIPALLTYGPAVTSGATMLLAGMNPIMGVGMMAGSVLFPGLARKRTKQLLEQEEEKRQALYSEYLAKVEQQLDQLCRQQAQVLRKQSPDPASELSDLLANHQSLWSRRPAHADFLWLRLGTGDLPILADLRFPKEGLSMVDDPLRNQLEQFERRPRIMKSVPIGIDLAKSFSMGFTGKPAELRAYAAQLVGQLALHCGYDDLQLCLIGALEDDLAPLRWLPHTWVGADRRHLVAADRQELEGLLRVLDDALIPHRTDDERAAATAKTPTLVVLITQPELANVGAVMRLLFDATLQNVHVITLAEHTSDLPSRTDVAIGLNGGKARMVWQDGPSRQTQDLVPDKVSGSQLASAVSLMANTQLDLPVASAKLPTNVSLLDLFGVTDVNHLNILSRWDQADPITTLRAPLGIDEDGALCTLDIHEKGDGPHGLVAGTTGSGKSELLMSYLLAMAVSYSPKDVTFALIDYKGGGMANALADLPHTVGVITNLDGSTLWRSLASIESENKRRQQVFADVQARFGMSKMEIKQYQELYRSGKVSEPMPHLIIAVDEFAELKQQERDFMDKLIQAARIGRSLGVHLILATQQPAGVVDEQIMANTNFRLCLRMATAQDSQSILHMPDAALLSRPGSFYKQVGSVTTLAQSGYSGMDYVVDSGTMTGCKVEVLDHTGAVIGKATPPRARSANAMTQATAVCRYIIDAAARDHITARNLWMPVLEEKIPLDVLQARYSQDADPWEPSVLLGELDDPSRQRRAPVRYLPGDGRNVLVYGGLGSGKVMLLTTALQGLLTQCSPGQLQVYVLDFGDDGFSAYLAAPHVGDVLTSNEDEKLRRLLNMLEAEVTERHRVLGGSLASTPLAERLQQTQTPRILVVLSHLSAIQEHLEDVVSEGPERLVHLLKDGPRWGVNFLATQEGASGVRYKLQGCFAKRYVLQMDHDDDYRTLLGRTGGKKPAAVRGRGLTVEDDEVLEFQVATAGQDVTQLCKGLARSWSGPGAPVVPVLPEHVLAADLVRHLDARRPLLLPVGIDTQTLDVVRYPFDNRTLHLMLGKEADVADLLEGLTQLAQHAGLDVTSLDAESAEASADVVRDMYEECKRMKALMDEGTTPQGNRRLVVVRSPKRLFASLDTEASTLLRAMLLTARPQWRWTFVVCGTAQELGTLRYSQDDQEWFKESVCTTEGIFVGGGLDSQMLLQVSGGVHVRQENRFPLGYVVLDGYAQQVKLLEG